VRGDGEGSSVEGGSIEDNGVVTPAVGGCGKGDLATTRAVDLAFITF